jgi:hypothetical protein
MTKTIEVEIDDRGTIRPMDPTASLPHGRALLVWRTETDHDAALLSEPSLAVDWLRPEEDEAWAYMLPDR